MNERFTVPRSPEGNGALEHPLNTHLDLDNAEEDKRRGDTMAVIGFGVMLVLFLWWLLSDSRLGLKRKH